MQTNVTKRGREALQRSPKQLMLTDRRSEKWSKSRR